MRARSRQLFRPFRQLQLHLSRQRATCTTNGAVDPDSALLMHAAMVV